GALPPDMHVEDVRLGAGRIGECDRRARVIRVDVPRCRDAAEVLAHEIAHALTPELTTPATWHGEPFERERLRLVGLMRNALKRRENSSRGNTTARPGGRRPTSIVPAPGRGPDHLTRFDGTAHRPTSFPRRPSMRNPTREYADGDRPQARE